MIKFVSKFVSQLGGTWTSASTGQKVIVSLIFAVLVFFMVFLVFFSSSPAQVFLFTNGISDQVLLEKIVLRLDQEGLPYTVDSSSRIKVNNVAAARYLRNILLREKLLPQDTDPWELFDVTRWTQTDFERNINLQRSITRQIKQHIESIDDVDNAEVTLVLPEDTLFKSDRNPVTASVILNIKPGSDIRENRQKLEGIEQLILFAIEGLNQESLTISDSTGTRLNDFSSFVDFDGIELTKRQLEIKAEVERRYKNAIFDSLAVIYTRERVRIVNIDVEMDFNKKSQETTENYPIVVKKDNPLTPFDESEVVLSVIRSQQKIDQSYQGSGFNPEGPPGVEGQVPPSYKDLDGLVSQWNHNENRINNEINQRIITEEKQPGIVRVSAGVAIDGVWRKEYNIQGIEIINADGSIKRTYTGLGREELQQAQALVESAVGYDINRNDRVTVENIQFDKFAFFAAEDARIRARLRWIRILQITGIVILAILIIILIFRVISQLVENYRLRKEEELASKYRKMREEQISAFRIEERGESELDILTNEVMGRARQNPNDVAKLIKMWVDETATPITNTTEVR